MTEAITSVGLYRTEDHRSPTALAEVIRFMRHVDFTDTCWVWMGGRLRSGYGAFWFAGKQSKAHRFAYEAWVGSIPTGLQIDHLCRNKSCVRASHLEAVTARENLRRSTSFIALNIVKTTCPRGHVYSGRNNQGRRICHTCARDWMRQHRAGAAA